MKKLEMEEKKEPKKEGRKLYANDSGLRCKNQDAVFIPKKIGFCPALITNRQFSLHDSWWNYYPKNEEYLRDRYYGSQMRCHDGIPDAACIQTRFYQRNPMPIIPVSQTCKKCRSRISICNGRGILKQKIFRFCVENIVFLNNRLFSFA